ncbi:MAG: tetratricopeptide repeat protein [Spirochaetes bacterium]|nr:tetratricopeptide repeat protein [Spirochaetota bacterium]
MKKISILSILISLFLAAVLIAGEVEDLVEKGNTAFDKWDYSKAIEYYKEALKKDEKNFTALWKTANAYINLGVLEQEDDDKKESLFNQGSLFAQKAVKEHPQKADGYAMLSIAEGRLAMFAGGKRKVELSKSVKKNAQLALKYDPNHDGALHVLGAWHREVATLGGFLKFFAKVLYGGLPDANMKDSIKYLEKAVKVKPSNIEHHLDLAKSYIEEDMEDKARKELKLAIELPPTEGYDKLNKAEAKELLEDLD